MFRSGSVRDERIITHRVKLRLLLGHRRTPMRKLFDIENEIRHSLTAWQDRGCSGTHFRLRSALVTDDALIAGVTGVHVARMSGVVD
jgi:hypothetical protein